MPAFVLTPNTTLVRNWPARHAALAPRLRERRLVRLSCTGESSNYLEWLERNKRQPRSGGNGGGGGGGGGAAGERVSKPRPPETYLEQLESTRRGAGQPARGASRPGDNGGGGGGTAYLEQLNRDTAKRKFGGGPWGSLRAALHRFAVRSGYAEFATAAAAGGGQQQQQQSRLAKLRSYGVAAVIAYGMFDAVTYSASFVVALLSFRKASNNAPLTWRNLLKVLGGMWLLNNFSRPFRVAGAVLLAPMVDKYAVKPLANSFAKRSRRRSSSS